MIINSLNLWALLVRCSHHALVVANIDMIQLQPLVFNHVSLLD